MRSALGCATLGLLLLLVAGTFDAEPLYVTGSALLLLGAGAAIWISAGAWGASVRRELDARSVVEEEPLSMRIEATRGPAAAAARLDRRAAAARARPLHAPAAGARACASRSTFGRRGRRVLPPPALVLRDPFGLAQRVVEGGEPDELLVLPRVLPVIATAGGEDGDSAHARAALTAAAETEIDGLRPHREGAPASRIHWPRARPRRRADGAQADLRGRLAPARRARPARAGVARGARRGRARRRLADRALRQARRLRAAAAGRPARPHDRARPARAGPRPTSGSRWSRSTPARR